MSNQDKEQNEKLLQLVQDALEKDKRLREQFAVGEKFRFIQDRLNALLSRAEEACSDEMSLSARQDVVLESDETLVYVCLFNAHGATLQTWHKLMHPSVFYEYSVNRPIYLDKADVEAVIRSKPNKAHYGYLTIAVKKADILIQPALDAKKESGYSLTKVREGALEFSRFSLFHHNGNVYILNAEGVLVHFQ
ncbi:MAG TPA: type IVB secretion system protein IcmQ [Gammaproteobacteria bacterium]|jgi:intracellular multiplication protein IcmQ|nr:type IVB secretion system protein IcmQ [Gammaproteobacteria bacterium]